MKLQLCLLAAFQFTQILANMTGRLFDNIFECIEPFRSTLLSMLPPFDIAKLLAATGWKLSGWEIGKHMNIIDDILEDSSDITMMRSLGMKVRIFGLDLDIMEQRLRDPSAYLAQYKMDHCFHVFVVATSQLSDDEQSPTLIQDFRPESQQHLVPDDMGISEIVHSYSSDIATSISKLSNWVLCAPCLSETLPSGLPGWIPVFNARKCINIRAYISTFNGCNSRVLYMDRDLTRRVFGFSNNEELLANLSTLETKYMTLENQEQKIQKLRGHLALSIIHTIHTMEDDVVRTKLLIVHSIHSRNAAITLELT